MWGAADKPPETMEGGPPDPVLHAKDTCEQNKNQLETLKEIMLKNKQSLKEKEEEVQEYARRLSSIKHRVILTATRRVKREPSYSNDDYHETKSANAKSSLLQRKLMENRKAFEQRNKKITENKRAVEEKVEAIRQQLEEKNLTPVKVQNDQLVTPVKTEIIKSEEGEQKNKIEELHNKIVGLEATIIDLQENLKEKDSVIDSKTKAITLMSADLSKKGKTTLDTLEDTKDEMRTMQEHFVLMETSLKNKNENLLEQLSERDNRISELNDIIKRREDELTEQKLTEMVHADKSRSAIDTLADAKDAMKSMQENFILIESSLKLKNDNLLQQLLDYEIKLAEANEKIFQLESGTGITKTSLSEDIQYKLNKLEESNKQLQDEKYELQKSIADIQNTIIVSKSDHGSSILMEKDNRIAELEESIEKLKRTNKLAEEECTAELQKQIANLSLKNEEYSNKISDLEKLVQDLEIEKDASITRVSKNITTLHEDEKILQLTKELDDLNKSTIKMKAQHKSKIKNLQKQLESFKMVSDTNAELVRLGNQVTLLEEEKGNLQLSLVDFDELKASAGDWQERIVDLESKVSIQRKEIQMHINATSTLENEKLDFMQELYTLKQQVSTLEAKVIESENLRVTAEMKVVDLEEQLDSISKLKMDENKLESLNNVSQVELVQKLETLIQENSVLSSKLAKLEDKGTSDTGSTESFETIQDGDKSELLKKIEYLTQQNNDLTLKLTKLEEKSNSRAGSTESFETIHDMDKSELLKKVEQLTQENNDLTMKLNRNDEKGSSDAGSTESFERISENNENTLKIEHLMQENSDLLIKINKLEEKLVLLESDDLEKSIPSVTLKLTEDVHNDISESQSDILCQKDDTLVEMTNLKIQLTEITDENTNLQKQIDALTTENNDIALRYSKLQEHLNQIKGKRFDIREDEKTDLQKEIITLQESQLRQSSDNITLCEIETDDKKLRMSTLLEENAEIAVKVKELEELNQNLTDNLDKITQEKNELREKIDQIMTDSFAKERLELINKLEKLNQEKESVAQERQELHEEISTLLHKSAEEPADIQKTNDPILQIESSIVASLEQEIKECKHLIAEQTNIIEEMKLKLAAKEEELDLKRKQIAEYEASGIEIQTLQNELKDMQHTIEEWKFKCTQMEEKMQELEAGKASIENSFKLLQEENAHLFEDIDQKETEKNSLKEDLESIITSLESKLQEELVIVSKKDDEIINIKSIIDNKEQELQNMHITLTDKMAFINILQEEVTVCKAELQRKDSTISSLTKEVEQLNDTVQLKEDEIYSLKKENTDYHEKLNESVSSKEYNKLLEELRDNEMLVNTMQNKIDERMKERNDLLGQIESISQTNTDMQLQLDHKNEEFNEAVASKENLLLQITEMEKAKSETEKRLWDLQNIWENNTKYVDDLQSELKNVYKTMEQLKSKHVEDTKMYDRRVEYVIEELNLKRQENEVLNMNLQEQEKVINQSFPEEIKVMLETKNADLEQKLTESENKIQTQLEKMKKIAANLKKKTALCQELEKRVVELEEKWTTEKDEKEAKNKKNQEIESSMREKDNKIADLEGKLAQAKNEIAEALDQSAKLTNEVVTSKDKMALMMEQITEMGEEIERCHADIEKHLNELAAEKAIKEDILTEYKSYKKETILKSEQQQLILDEVKEEARELSVRMQVMEAEYVEQLALIQNLQAENGLLSSKQIQINEKLENVEKESEERRLLIEQLQIEKAKTTNATTQTSEEDLRHIRISGAEHYDHCEQCRTVIEACEVRLLQREAEIDNLNNELSNSIANFVQMSNSMRVNDIINDLTEKARNADALYTDLMKNYDERGQQIQALQQDSQIIREEAKQSIDALKAQISLLESEKHDLKEKWNASQHLYENLQQEVSSLVRERSVNLDEIKSLETKLEAYKQKIVDTAGNKEDLLGNVSKNMDNFESDASNEKYGSLELFNASKIFGDSFNVSSREQNEVVKLRSLLDDKEIQCAALKQEVNVLQAQIVEERSILAEYNHGAQNLNLLQEQAEKKVEGLDHSIVEGTQLLDQRQNLDDKLKELTLIKDGEIQDLKKELDFMKSSMEILIKERDEYKHLSNSYKSKDNDDLQKEIRSSDDVDMLEDLEDRISRITKERNILQLQVNDLTRSLEETTTSLEGQRNAQIEMERMQRERDEAKQEIINLTRALEDYRSDITSAKNNVVSQNSMESSTSADDVILHESVQSAAIAMPVEQNVLPQTVFLEPGSTWDSDSNEKLNVDEETWGWNEADAQLVGDSHFTPVKIIPTEEVQLRTRVDELQDQIKDLESEKIKMIEENKVMQIRSGKIIKKLKEYKVQIENLQKQLNIQKSTSGFCELDSAIEEELKSQINGLEKTLNETNEELKNVVAEKDALSKRLDVLVTANERYMELKERQDMDMEILRIQNKELLNKVQSIEWQLQEYQSNSEIDSSSTNADHVKPLSSETTQTIVQTDTSKVHSDEDLQVLCNKYKEEVEDLKDEMEALATENEQLQHYLEEQKITISNLKVKAATDMNDFVQNQGEIDKKNIELQNKLEKSEKEYEQLRKQFEQCLMDANDQVSTMRQNNDALKAEISEKADKLETEIKTLRQQTETSELTANELRKQLENVIQEKEILEKTAVAAHSTEEKLSAITVSLGDVTELLNARVQEVADLKQELQKQYVDRQTAEAKLQDTIQMLTREMNEKKEELDKLREAFSNKEDELAQQKSMVTLNNIVSEATHELVQKHAMEIEEKQKEVCNLEEQLVTLKSALEKSSLELEKHVININAKEQELAEKDLLLKSANSELIVIKDEMLKKQTILDHYDKNIQKHDEEIQNKSSEIISLQSYLNESILTLKQLQEQISRFHDLETDNENLKTTLSIKESILSKLEEELREYNVHLQNKTQEINNLHVELQQINVLKNNLQRNTEEIFLLTSELDVSHKMLEETRNILQEKESLLEITNQKLNEKQEELNNLTVAMSHSDERPWNSNTVDGLPLFKMDNDNGDDTRNTLNELRRQMVEKEKEIEHLKYVLHENTYPRIIQEMQDRIDCLYDEKANLETSLREVTQTLEQKQSQLDLQMQLDRQKLLDQEAIIAKLKNELQTKEREMYELKSTIAKQNTQLSHHTINKFQPDDYKLHETIRRLTNELQDKEQEVEYAKAHNNELQNEILQFNSAVQKEVERISQESKDAIQQLQSEKEEIQVRAEQFVGEKLKEKEMEIDGIKQKLSIENENLLRDLQLRDKDIHNLQMQLRDSLVEWDAKLRQKEDQLTRVSTDLAEKEKRLNELYVTKEAELNNLKVQIHDKDIRIEELLALSAEEEKQLAELKQFLEVREAEINSLNNQLEIKIKEYELMQRALQKDIPIIERQTIQDSETSPTIENKELHSSELDLALYMLHQRDVRCEELTHELMQLLEERDTLQLRLSNAIRINEELRKTAASESIPKDIPSSLEENQSPLVEHPSPSKSDGPVEIAKEAIDSPIEEDKEALTLKLSQLHTLGHTKDVRLRDERELRHTQQMSLLAHKDVLSTLPPEAAARLVNANYTLSRDVQSQSSVLLNWLWGKSTPKVVHM